MNKRMLKRILDDYDLKLVKVTGAFGNATNIVLAAPDGTEGKFIISRLDDQHSDLLNRNQFKHFAAEHPAPVVVQQEIQQATRRVFAHQPRAEFITPKELSQPEPPPEPTPEPPVPKPILTLTKPPPAPKPRKSMDRMSQVEFFRLCTLLNGIDMTGIDSLTKLGERLTLIFGTRVPPSTAQDALKATGRKLDKVIEATSAQQVIALALCTLLEKLNEPVPDDLRAIAGTLN